jgi:hypothetical protein
MARRLLAKHNLSSMDKDAWVRLAEQLGLRIHPLRLRGRVRAPSPGPGEEDPLEPASARALLALRALVTDRCVLRRFNNASISWYLMGVFTRKR